MGPRGTPRKRIESMSLELISLLIIVGWAVFVIVLERLFPYDKQDFFRDGFFNDFFMYSIVQAYFMGVTIAAVITFIDSNTGLSRLQLVSDWPLWAQCLFFFFLHDFYMYWFHRLQHRHSVLWRTHEAHHSVKDIDWVAGSRSHPLEILINQTIEFAPIVLLGAAPEVAIFKATIDACWGMWIHANIDVRTGPLQYVINGPEMHRWHHSDELDMPGKNFSTKIATWDWIFGTAYLPTHKPGSYGLGGEDFPLKAYHGEAAPGLWGRVKHVARVCAADAWVYIKQCLALFRPFHRSES